MGTVTAFKNSLVVKLMLAFMLVAVPPMLIASNVSTNLVSTTVNRNIERWLHEATNFMLYLIDESLEEAAAASVLLRHRLAAREIVFTEEELRHLPDLDVDYIQVRSAGGEILYPKDARIRIEDEPLFAGSSFKWGVTKDNGKMLGLAVSNTIRAWDGSERIVDFVSWFSIQLAEPPGSEEPFEVRILLPQGDTYEQAYASSDSPPYRLSDAALRAVGQGADEYFIPDDDWTDNTPNAHFMLKTVRDEDGGVLAIYVTSVNLLHGDRWGASTAALFWAFFVLGSALSLGCGYLLAKRLVRPIRRLNEGVKSIADGEFGYQVVVSGKDEVAELSDRFNLMSRQLAVMQREHVQSARQERTRVLGEIALGFAHEIRNPLVVIKTSAEVVQGKLSAAEKEARLLGFVVEEVGRIDSLLTEFLSFAKPAPLKLEHFALREVADDVLHISGAELARRGIAARLDDETTDSIVLGERNQIHQVLLNLVLNSMDAMPDGGELVFRLYPSANGVCLDVGDTGTGIAEELLPTVHMPFISTKKAGLGLGLAKAYAVIEEHGGAISCRSKAGEGTVFTVCLHK